MCRSERWERMVPEKPRDLKVAKLTAFFAELAVATKMAPLAQDLAGKLAQFFKELPAIPSDQAMPDRPHPTHSDLLQFFAAVQFPLEAAKSRGGRLNLWAVSGLKHNEVRTAGALAGLWRAEFGGRVSQDFLAFYLNRAVRLDRNVQDVNWHQELCNGYSIFTEVNPLGDLSDRVDLVIETVRYLIGIEIKIRAGLGDMQLERYASALAARARYTQKSSLLILLAPFPVMDSEFNSSSWRDVSAAARRAVKRETDAKTLVHHAISQFGDHVAQH